MPRAAAYGGCKVSLVSGMSDFFGLDIGTTAARVVQLKGKAPVKSLVSYASMAIEDKLSLSDSPRDRQKLAQTIKELIAKSNLSTNNVAVGIPSQRVFTTLVDMDRLDSKELSKSIKYQADSIIPTPLSESKIDWSLLGDSPKDKTKIEVLISSVTNTFVEQRLDMLESIGLNVISFEPDNLALVRAMIAPDATLPQMVVDLGHNSTDLVVVMNGAPRLTRSIATGSSTIIRAAAQNLNVDYKQADQFVFKFGLAQDRLEGQIHNAIKGAVDNLMTDIEKTIKFFQTRYNDSKIDRIIVTGAATSLPELPLYIANRFGVSVEIGNAWRNVTFPANKQNELLNVSGQFGVAAGLAERSE